MTLRYVQRQIKMHPDSDFPLSDHVADVNNKVNKYEVRKLFFNFRDPLLFTKAITPCNFIFIRYYVAQQSLMQLQCSDE